MTPPEDDDLANMEEGVRPAAVENGSSSSVTVSPHTAAPPSASTAASEEARQLLDQLLVTEGGEDFFEATKQIIETGIRARRESQPYISFEEERFAQRYLTATSPASSQDSTPVEQKFKK